MGQFVTPFDLVHHESNEWPTSFKTGPNLRNDGDTTSIEPEAFKVVAAIDLTLIAPTLILGGVLLRRRSHNGYIVAGIAGILGSVYLPVLSVNTLIAIGRGFQDARGALPIWLPLLASTTVATGFFVARTHNKTP